jgi:hypothetical protein
MSSSTLAPPSLHASLRGGPGDLQRDRQAPAMKPHDSDSAGQHTKRR